MARLRVINAVIELGRSAVARGAAAFDLRRHSLNSRFLRFRLCALLAGLTFVVAPCAMAEPVDYEKQVKPIFTARCIACHGVLKQEGGLRLDTGAFARQGGDSGEVVTPGDAASSVILDRIEAVDAADRMPQEGEPLTAEQVAVVRQWIAEGASSPADEVAEKDPREHWAFRQVVKPRLPETANAGWVRNPIDAFVSANHTRHGLTPQVEATRSQLIRRLYLDLVGLPPTLAQIREAEADQSEGWYERLVEELLASPRHGERWARHWMDIWRYSDWWGLGEERRNSQPHIWHWRDWIVESLNANVSYDEMVRLMLAGDELYPNDLDKLRATGFLARQYYLFNRNSWLEETVEHVSKGFLGLTMNCAKCHDHKFDPIAQADFYRMRAFFEPYYVRMDSVPGEPDLTRDGIPRAFDGDVDTPTYLYIRGQESDPDKSAPMKPGVPKLFDFADIMIQEVPVPVEAREPDRRPWVIETHIHAATKKLDDAKVELVAANERLADAIGNSASSEGGAGASPTEGEKRKQAIAKANADVDAAECAVACAAAQLSSVKSRAEAMKAQWAKIDDKGGTAAVIEAARQTANKAIAAQRRAELSQSLFAVADTKRRLLTAPMDQKPTLEAQLTMARESRNNATKALDAPIGANEQFAVLSGGKQAPTRFNSTLEDDKPIGYAKQSTGRRKALAEWITDRRNPLTARVAVNHIWNRHFGTPLAPNVFDLGRNSPTPSNVELLDWLAAEFMESGWNMKHLHRLIVNSATYRMSSDLNNRDAELAKDADNVNLWRRNTIRLDAEVIRDSVLSLAGALDLTMGGPTVATADEDNSRRRSIYFFHSNNERNLFLTTFDLALVTECYRREQSIVPQQALAMTNSKLVLECSKPIADQIAKAVDSTEAARDDSTYIRSAFELLLGSIPNDAEISASMGALEQWRKLNASPEDTRSYLVWSLLNHNDFITLR